MCFSQADPKVCRHLSPPAVALCYPEQGMRSPPFMLTRQAFPDFSKALQKAMRWGLNLAEIQELHVFFFL